MALGKKSPYKIGDMLTTLRTDLGNDLSSEWLLCNGAEIDAEVYPELSEMLQSKVTPKSPASIAKTSRTNATSRIYSKETKKWYTIYTSGVLQVSDNPIGTSATYSSFTNQSGAFYNPKLFYCNDRLFCIYNTSNNAGVNTVKIAASTNNGSSWAISSFGLSCTAFNSRLFFFNGCYYLIAQYTSSYATQFAIYYNTGDWSGAWSSTATYQSLNLSSLDIDFDRGIMGFASDGKIGFINISDLKNANLTGYITYDNVSTSAYPITGLSYGNGYWAAASSNSVGKCLFVTSDVTSPSVSRTWISISTSSSFTGIKFVDGLWIWYLLKRPIYSIYGSTYGAITMAYANGIPINAFQLVDLKGNTITAEIDSGLCVGGGYISMLCCGSDTESYNHTVIYAAYEKVLPTNSASGYLYIKAKDKG